MAADSAMAPDPGADEHRRDAERILEWALWRYQGDLARSDGAQKSAALMVTATGSAVALVTQALPDDPSAWHIGILGLALATGVVTIFLCVRVLVPRDQKLPSVQALRRLTGQLVADARLPILPVQFVVDVLNAGNLDDPSSPIGDATKVAAERMKWLTWAFLGFGLTFTWVMVLTFVIVITK